MQKIKQVGGGRGSIRGRGGCEPISEVSVKIQKSRGSGRRREGAGSGVDITKN